MRLTRLSHCREVAPVCSSSHYIVFSICGMCEPHCVVWYQLWNSSNFTSTQGMRLTRPNAGRLPQLAGSSCRPHNLLLPICCRPQPPPQTPNMLPPNIPNVLPQFVASFCFDKKIWPCQNCLRHSIYCRLSSYVASFYFGKKYQFPLSLSTNPGLRHSMISCRLIYIYCTHTLPETLNFTCPGELKMTIQSW